MARGGWVRAWVLERRQGVWFGVRLSGVCGLSEASVVLGMATIGGDLATKGLGCLRCFSRRLLWISVMGVGFD